MVQGTKSNEITFAGVTISVWNAEDPKAPHHDLFEVDVGAPGDDEWICVGGGASTPCSDGSPTHLGNFLTASFPSLDDNGEANWKGWISSSRDHTNSDPSILTGFAIGMKIPNLSKQELISNLKLFKSTSDPAPHPETSCFVDYGEFLLLGGGFEVLDLQDGGGNLATGSFPDSTFSWRARSKDHMVPTPCRIRAYAVGIRPSLKKVDGTVVGDVITAFHSFEDLYPKYPIRSKVSPLQDMALCGGGAASHYLVNGRYLVGLVPEVGPDQSFTGISLSVGELNNLVGQPSYGAELGFTTAYAMGIKVEPGLHCNKKIPITDAVSSGYSSSSVPRNAIDKNPNTKWQSTSIPNPWIRLALGGEKRICRVDITWADTNQYRFNISVSSDGNAYTDILIGQIRAGTSTTVPQPCTFSVTLASFIQITITQSTPGSISSTAQISEISVFSDQA